MIIIYRISNNSYNKVRLENATKQNCLENALYVFSPENHQWILLGDQLNEETNLFVQDILTQYDNKIKYKPIVAGSGAKSFNFALDEALKLDENEIIYFIEDDYIHIDHSNQIIQDGLNLGASYVTLYLHPDKFISPQNGGNPEVDIDGGYLTKLYRGQLEIFYLVNSTTMTFASTVKTLKEDESILREFTSGTYPRDYEMFLSLREKGRTLLCPVNAYSTHAEKAWLSPIKQTINSQLENSWDGRVQYIREGMLYKK